MPHFVALTQNKVFGITLRIKVKVIKRKKRIKKEYCIRLGRIFNSYQLIKIFVYIYKGLMWKVGGIGGGLS